MIHCGTLLAATVPKSEKIDMYHPPATDLHIETRGSGDPALFVHGSGGDLTSWTRQLPLADAYELILVDRRGYGESPPRSFAYDLAQESAELAALITAPIHLVGQSYGGVLALLVAATKPQLIRTLTVSEPPAFAVARDHPDVEWLVERLAPVITEEASLTPDAFAAQFDAAIGLAHDPTPPASGRRLKNLDAARMEQAAWLATIALETLAAAPFPKLVISGGWDDATDAPLHRSGRAYAAVCDVLEQRLRAKRVVIRGAGHVIPRTGPPYNDCLRVFLATANPG
jgi:pimeloyl-ACP methyl ester carboxylesterase